jgi:hypothetical protein
MNSNQTTPVRPAGLRRPFLVSIAFGLLLLLPPPNAGAQATPVVFSFTNAAPITINNGFSDSTPFPSTIQVPALPGTLQNVTVTLFGLSDDQSYSIEILLTGPTGQGVDLMSEAGDGLVTNATVTIADAGEPFPAGVITSGAYQPSGASYASGTAFPFYSPFYQEDTTNQMAGFIGTMLGGSWSLSEYYTDFYPNGSISGGWSLNFTLLPAAPGVTNLAASPVATDSATLNANVSPGGAPTTVYFEYGLTTAYGNFSATNVLTNDVIDTQEVSLPITNLAAGATYHFQAVAQNEAGTNVAGDMTFVATAVVTAPVLQVSITNGNQLVLIVQGAPGSNYVILATHSLAPPITWTTVTNLTLTNAVESINLGPLPAQPEFFEVEAALPAPPALAVSPGNGSGPILTLSGNTGTQYIIMSAASLSPPITWSTWTNVTLTNPVQTISLGPPTNLMQFFRAVQP